MKFKLTFKRELKDEEALAPLKEGIKNGKMGSLTVDPESLEVKKNSKGKCSYNPDALILLLSFFFYLSVNHYFQVSFNLKVILCVA